jgi:CHAD domain-containing protein
MSARLQHQVATPRIAEPRVKPRPAGKSAFEELCRTVEGYLSKASDARKRLLDGPYDAKLLHAWRVSLRRVTATLKDIATLSDDDLGDVLDYLRHCREATGSCRDLDILVQETLPGFIDQAGSKRNDHGAVQQHLLEQQQRAHRQAMAALRKHSLVVPLRAWRRWVDTLEPPSDKAVRKAAAAAIEQRYVTLKKRAEKLDGGQKRLHRLRSAAKKLRYSIELYQHAFPKHTASTWLKPLAELQTHLGLAHDRMMARRMFGELVATEHAQGLTKPFRRWSKRTGYVAAEQAMHALTALDDLEPYWRNRAH